MPSEFCSAFYQSSETFQISGGRGIPKNPIGVVVCSHSRPWVLAQSKSGLVVLKIDGKAGSKARVRGLVKESLTDLGFKVVGRLRPALVLASLYR